jgi:excisionase family DNA binding protein
LVIAVDTAAVDLAYVARYLDLGKSTVRRMALSGEMPGWFVVAGRWRILRRDFDAYLDAKRAEAEQRYRPARRAS